MIICGMHPVKCQGLSFGLHKTFWSTIQQGRKAQEAQFENKWEESVVEKKSQMSYLVSLVPEDSLSSCC